MPTNTCTQRVNSIRKRTVPKQRKMPERKSKGKRRNEHVSCEPPKRHVCVSFGGRHKRLQRHQYNDKRRRNYSNVSK